MTELTEKFSEAEKRLKTKEKFITEAKVGKEQTVSIRGLKVTQILRFARKY